MFYVAIFSRNPRTLFSNAFDYSAVSSFRYFCNRAENNNFFFYTRIYFRSNPIITVIQNVYYMKRSLKIRILIADSSRTRQLKIQYEKNIVFFFKKPLNFSIYLSSVFYIVFWDEFKIEFFIEEWST